MLRFKLTRTLLYVVCILSMLLASCVSTGDKISGPRQYDSGRQANKAGRPQLSVFFRTVNTDTLKPTILLKQLEIFDGVQWLTVEATPYLYDVSKNDSRQELVTRSILPVGSYSQIRLTFDDVNLFSHDAYQQLKIENATVTLALEKNLVLAEQDSLSLFFVCDIKQSLVSELLFVPAVHAYRQEVPLTTELAFVSCPDINTIYIIRTDQNRICASFGIKGRPTYIKAFKSNDDLYVLAESDKAIRKYALSSGQQKDEITIPLIVKPQMMAIDADGAFAYLTDRASDFVYRVSLSTGSLDKRQRVAEGLNFISFLEESDRVAVTATTSQKVLLLEPSSLQVLDSIPTGSGPSGHLSYGGNLYITETGSNSVMIYSFGTGSIMRKNVGFKPVRAIVYDGHIFVSNSLGSSLSVLLPDQLTTLKEVRVGGRPVEMGVSINRNWLYATDIKENGVAVVDLTSHRFQSRIDLQSPPTDIEIIE